MPKFRDKAFNEETNLRSNFQVLYSVVLKIYLFSKHYLILAQKCITFLTKLYDGTFQQTLHKKLSFPLRISSVNVTKSAGI